MANTVQGKIRIVRQSELGTYSQASQAVFPITSDMGVYNTKQVKSSKYMPFINVHAFTNNNNAYSTRSIARNAIPLDYRKRDLIITYNVLEDGVESWICERFTGNSFGEGIWSSDVYWTPFVVGNASGGSAGSLVTTFETSLTPANESFNQQINLHKVSKTGKNIHLVDYVGERIDDGGDTSIGCEVFNCYVYDSGIGNYLPNVAEGVFNHVEGASNKTLNLSYLSHIEGYANKITDSAYSHISGSYNTITGENNVFITGTNNTSTNDCQFIGGKYSNSTEILGFNKDFLFVLGNGEEGSLSNAYLFDIDGEQWSQTDVTCGNTYDNPEHRLSDKFGTNDLVTDATMGDEYDNYPVSYGVVRNLYNQMTNDHKAYFFETVADMVNALQGATPPYLKDDVLYITDETYTPTPPDPEDPTTYALAFFVVSTEETSTTYQYDTTDELIDDLAENGTVQMGYYNIARKMNDIVDLSEYQKKLYDTVNRPAENSTFLNLKTINNQSILRVSGTEPDNIPFPTVESTISGNESSSNAPSCEAVYNYIQQATGDMSSLKKLNTTYTVSFEPEENELLSGGIEVKLHKISKTGKNTDLIEFVGKRVGNNEIFNIYSSNSPSSHVVSEQSTYSHVEGRENTVTEYSNYSHVEGVSNIANHNYVHIGGRGNRSYADYQTIIGKYAAPEADDIFVIGYGDGSGAGNTVFCVKNNGATIADNRCYMGAENAAFSTEAIYDRISDEVESLLTAISPFELTSKYYVDKQCLNARLYKGLVNDNSALANISNLNNGEIRIAHSVNIGTTENPRYINNIPYLHVSSDVNNPWKPLYSTITYTTSAMRIVTDYIGGTGNNVLLHKIAKTGDYYDLSNRPEPDLPRADVKFKNVEYTEDSMETIGNSGIRRFKINAGEPESSMDTAYPITHYYDSKIRITLSCSREWITENIINEGANCKYYVILQRVQNGNWKTVMQHTGSQHSPQEQMEKYRTLLSPQQLYSLPISWQVGNNSYFTLPYTVRDIIMAFSEFTWENEESPEYACLWDVLNLGSTKVSNGKMSFKRKYSFIKGLQDPDFDTDADKKVNAFASTFRIGLVEFDEYTNSTAFSGPKDWTYFKVMFKYDNTVEAHPTFRCSGKFTKARIKI